jgi:hypothetical protein
MTAKVISNRASYNNSRQGVGGIGGRNLPDGNISWVGIVGKTGDVIYLSANDVTSNDKPYAGWAFQSIGGSHQVSFTLQNMATSTNPDPEVQANVVWCNAPASFGTPSSGTALTVPENTMVTVFFPFAAIRVTFAADGEFYCVAR